MLFTGIGRAVLHGQDVEISYPYSVFTIEDGLTQMQIRDIYIDSTGYVWIATQGGLNGYDGTSFHTYPNLGRVSEDYITRVFRGRDKIFGSAASGLFAYDGKSAEVWQPSINDVHPPMGLLFEDPKSHVWVEAQARFYILSEGELISVGDVYPELANLSIKHAWGAPHWNRVFLMDQGNRFYSYDPSSSQVTVDSTTFASSDLVKLTILGRTYKTSSISIAKMNGEIPLSIYAIMEERLDLVASRDEKTGNMIARNENAPIGYDAREGNQSTMYFRQDSIYLPAPWLHISHIRFCVDGDHKTYIGTDSGLYVVYLNGLQNIKIRNCEYPWSVVPMGKEVVLSGCYRTGGHAFKTSGQYIQTYDFASPKMDAIFDAQILSNYARGNNTTIFGSIRGFYFLKEGAAQLENFYLDKAVEAFYYAPITRQFIVASDKLYIIDPALTTILDSIDIPDRLLNNTGITDIEKWGEQSFWVSTNFGLCFIDRMHHQEKVFQGIAGTLPCQGAVSLVRDGQNRLWAGATCGLLRYEEGYDQFIKILPDLINNRVNQVQLLPGQRLACVANNELFILDISLPDPLVLMVFSSKNGLHLLEPAENGIAISGERYVWMASATGVQRLDLGKQLLTNGRPSLKVIDIAGNLIQINHLKDDSIILKGQSALFKLSLIDHSGKNWKYQYAKNDGSFSPWQESTEILVSGLHHGKNNLVFRAKWMGASATEVVETSSQLTVFIPFWQRITTLWGMAIVIFSGIIFFIWREVHRRRQLTLLTSKLYLNRLKTIQAYLNPHFLFNALTSIQDYILHKDRKEGSKMVVSLSRILRQVLDFGNSKMEIQNQNISLVRLSQEISFLKDYLYLENKQQTIPFTSDIVIDPMVLESDPMIPPLLIQPFFENAIKHAFREKDTDKQINLKIHKKENTLYVLITDNGKGISVASSHTNGTSLGIKLARERMDILNKLGFPNDIKIRDVKPGGTAVEITITLLI